jgi:hypothetical protein
LLTLPSVSLPYLGYVNWEHPLLTLGHDPKIVPKLDDLFYDKDQTPIAVKA